MKYNYMYLRSLTCMDENIIQQVSEKRETPVIFKYTCICCRSGNTEDGQQLTCEKPEKTENVEDKEKKKWVSDRF